MQSGSRGGTDPLDKQSGSRGGTDHAHGDLPGEGQQVHGVDVFRFVVLVVTALRLALSTQRHRQLVKAKEGLGMKIVLIY